MQNILDASPGARTPTGAIQLHGVLVRVEGMGVLLLGESGTGKSECALELISAGHRLVADDVVEVSRRGDRIVGTSPPFTRHLLAIRRMGIINVRDLFGEGVIESESYIDLCVEIGERPDSGEHMILGCNIPKLVFAGR